MTRSAPSKEEAVPLRHKHTLRKKVLTGVAITMILGLALGLGLGLTVGRRDPVPDPPEEPEPSRISSSVGTSILPWTPKVNDTWQITLSKPPLLAVDVKSITPDVAVFDVDLFDTPAETIEVLHRLGKKVICYFSAGSFEDWRPDSRSFQEGDKGNELDGWPGESWLNISSESVRGIMKSRVELASGKKCDGLDPDNVDGYDNNNGLGLTPEDSISLIEFLSSIARPLNMTLGLKNAGRIIPDVLPLVDFSVNEQCVQYNECEKFQKFIEAGKPVFHIEYPDKDANSGTGVETNLVSDLCGKDSDVSINGFSTVLKRMNLDGWVEYCSFSVANTPLNTTIGQQGSVL